ncbi:MAG: glycerol-3-phosphate acyltransferase [Clostridiales bacterium]|nr:glycerol-3-phosphate acyltransferase [Clostridiales bacterium]
MNMNVVLCAAMGYLLGMINPAYIFGKLHGFDIRKYGSGNAGATNATMIMGKVTGVVCMVLDVFKAFSAYRAAVRLFPMLTFAGALAGTACILGHIFPVWMHFSGGKGLACMLGVMLAHNWKVFLALLIAEILLVLMLGYICVMALSLSVLFPVVYVIATADLIGACVLALLIPVVFYKHMPNLRRITQGKEMHISWLWNAEQEEARIEKQYSEQEWKSLYKKVNQQ